MGWLDDFQRERNAKIVRRSLSSTFVRKSSTGDLFAVVGATSRDNKVRFRLRHMGTRQLFRVSESSFSQNYIFE